MHAILRASDRDPPGGEQSDALGKNFLENRAAEFDHEPAITAPAATQLQA